MRSFCAKYRSFQYASPALAYDKNFLIATGNHTAYKQVKGTKATAQEILDIYEGLTQSHLTDFDVLLSGYAPGAEAVNAVGTIAKDLKSRSEMVFWGLC